MEFVHVVPGGFAFGAVFGHAAPYLILNDQHTELFELLAQFLDVVANKPVLHIYIGAMVKHIE